MKEKDRFRKAPPNYAMKKTQLLKDKVRELKAFTEAKAHTQRYMRSELRGC